MSTHSPELMGQQEGLLLNLVGHHRCLCGPERDLALLPEGDEIEVLHGGRHVAEVVAEMSVSDEVSVAERPVEPTAGDLPVRVVGAIMVPHWREGLSVDALPDVYRDIVEVVADASDPM